MANDNHVVYAKNLTDVFYYLKTIQGLKILGSGTAEQHLHFSEQLALDQTALFLRNIEELKQIDKKERYIDFGSASTLTSMIDVGRKKLPSVLYEALISTANPLVRNIATLGGNICSNERKMTLFAPLLALDAKLEFKSSMQDSLFIPVSKFEEIKPLHILSRIRVPIEDWDVAIFKKLGPAGGITSESASFTFLAQSEKGILSDVRIAFCGIVSLRSDELENRLIGTRLPLSPKLKNEVLEAAAIDFFNQSGFADPPLHPILHSQYVELLEYALDMLS